MVELVRLPDVAMTALRLRGGSAHGLPAPGQSILDGSDRIVAIGPDEWLAIAEDGDGSALCDRLGTYGGVVVDVSGNRALYRVVGPRARWFLSAGCSLDLDRMQPGAAVSTLLGRAQIVLVADGVDSYLVLPRRSFASYLEAWAETVDDR